jgi:hypothetical protein
MLQTIKAQRWNKTLELKRQTWAFLGGTAAGAAAQQMTRP